jgi:hypothetical protein
MLDFSVLCCVEWCMSPDWHRTSAYIVLKQTNSNKNAKHHRHGENKEHCYRETQNSGGIQAARRIVPPNLAPRV